MIGHPPKFRILGFLLCPMGKCMATLGTRISRQTEPRVMVLVVSFFFKLKVDLSVGPDALKDCCEVTLCLKFLELLMKH